MNKKIVFRYVALVLASVAVFSVYSWFSFSSSSDLYFCTDEEVAALGSEYNPNKEITNIQEEYEGLRKFFCAKYGRPNDIYKFNSPDEMLNYFWSVNYAETASIKYEEEMLKESNFLLKPRSTSAIGNYVIPGSFMGMSFLYGNIARFFSNFNLPVKDVVLYLTPFFMVLSLWAFYYLVRIFFDKKISIFSVGVLATFPAVVYYASRSMYHNILFLSLLIIGLTLALYSVNHKSDSFKLRLWGYLKSVLSGLAIGMALFVRTSEIVWVSFIVGLIILLNIKGFFDLKNKKRLVYKWIWLFLFLTGILIAVLPLFLLNYNIYGQPLSIGYNVNIPQQVSDIYTQASLWFSVLVTPFGFNLDSILINSYNYLYKIYLPYSLAAIMGVFVLIFKFFHKLKNKNLDIVIKRQILYLSTFLLISVYMMVFYGSWTIIDRIDNATFSIGTSYTRYWLPIYVFSIPFISLAVVSVVSIFRRKNARNILLVLIFVIFSIYSAILVYWKTDESLVFVRDTIKRQQAKLIRLNNIANKDSVFVLGFKQADKIFFPEYKRIIPEMAVNLDYMSVKNLIDKGVDVYYYHFASDEYVRYISKKYFEPFGIRIEENKEKVWGKEYMYPIKLVNIEKTSK